MIKAGNGKLVLQIVMGPYSHTFSLDKSQTLLKVPKVFIQRWSLGNRLNHKKTGDCLYNCIQNGFTPSILIHHWHYYLMGGPLKSTLDKCHVMIIVNIFQSLDKRMFWCPAWHERPICWSTELTLPQSYCVPLTGSPGLPTWALITSAQRLEYLDQNSSKRMFRQEVLS